jgi:hypothetical protein
MRGSYRADHRGWLFNFLWPFTRYAFTNLSVIVLGIPLFFIFNRTRIIGRKRVPQQRNTLRDLRVLPSITRQAIPRPMEPGR